MLNDQSVSGYVAAIKSCRSCDELEHLHAHAVASRSDSNIHVATTLVDMYGRLGKVGEARRVFDGMPHHTLFSWNAMIMGYAHNGDAHSSWHIFTLMQERGVSPNARTYVGVLKACSSLASTEEFSRVDGKLVKANTLQKARDLHPRLRESGHERDIFVANTLLDVYSKCGSLSEAREVFDGMAYRSLVCWNAVVLGHAQNGESEEAWRLFLQMQLEGLLPDSRTFVAVVKACTSGFGSSTVWKVWLERVVVVQYEIAELGLESNTFVGNSLVDMYGKLGKMVEARRIFDRMESRSVVSWNVLIAGYVQNGKGEAALEVFSRMQEDGFLPDCASFIGALNACALMASEEVRQETKNVWLERGMSIHSQLAKSGYESNTSLANTLIDTYAKSGSLELAAEVFEKIRRRGTVVSWNIMITAHAQSDEPETALKLLSDMKAEGHSPDARTYLGCLNACSCMAERELGQTLKVKSLEIGFKLHAELKDAWFQSDVFLASSLVDLYSKCGSMGDAQRVFDCMEHKDVVSWTALLLGYAEYGDGEQALETFSQMVEGREHKPNAFSYAAVLKACLSLVGDESSQSVRVQYLETAFALHCQLAEDGYETDPLVVTVLLELYAKCGSLASARRVFDKMGEHQDVVAWTALIQVHVRHEQPEEALRIFSRVQRQGRLKPDALTFSAALKACASLACIERGRDIHEQIRKAGKENDPVVVNSLIGFYGRCGSMSEARRVFDSIQGRKDSVAWSALIAGYSHNGDAELVFELFERMRLEEDWPPDGVTFLSLLTACCHTGLVDRATEWFSLMVTEYSVVPGIEHYTCMVDMLGRHNRLNEAVEVVKRMPLKADSKIWTTVLDACRRWKNIEVGRLAFMSIQNVENDLDSAPYVLMANTLFK